MPAKQTFVPDGFIFGLFLTFKEGSNTFLRKNTLLPMD
jgi:hypothetical protein